MTHSPRETIFISHARPDEDELTLWLSGRLTARGYKVWADLEQLQGGSPFWSEIEDTIRNRSARFVILVSRTAVTRKGVLDELAEAGDVAKRLKDERFIIPLKVDDLPWDEFPIQLKRLNGFDFSAGWSTGLYELLDTLDRAGVPRSTGDPEVARVSALLTRSRQRVLPQPETAYLNWLPILTVPETIYYYYTSYSATDLSRARTQIALPHAPRDRLIVTFADAAAVKCAVPEGMEIELRYTVPLSEFLTGKPESGPQMQPYEARNILTNIVRQGFEGALRERGLIQFDHRWFVPRGWRPDNKGRYMRGADESYRVLVGKSKELTWHFGLSATVHIGPPGRIHLIPHVLFSPDGTTPLADQRSLRRSRCKLWWNDKWRDLILALLAEFFGKSTEPATLSLGGGASMTLSRHLSTVLLAATYAAEDVFLPDGEESVEWEREEEDDPAETDE